LAGRRVRWCGGGPEIAWYEAVPGGRGRVIVHAAVLVAAGPRPGQDVLIADLPAVRWAATVPHRGSMDDVIGSLWVLAGWIEDHGYRMAGHHREVYLDYCPEAAENGVTELQLPVARWLAREMNRQAGLLAFATGTISEVGR
jgi:predicted nucleic acid-binding Zn ribbon protein